MPAAAAKKLPALAFGHRVVGNQPVVEPSGRHLPVGVGGHQGLQRHRRAEVAGELGKEAVVAPLEAGEAHGRELALPVEQVEGHLAVEGAQCRQVGLEPFVVAEAPVEGRAGPGGEERRRVVDQPGIGDEVAAQAEDAR